MTFSTDVNSKTLSLNGNSLTIANLTMGVIAGGTASVVRNNHATTDATLTVSVPSGAITYAGTITDGPAGAKLAFTKIGAGTWQFGGGGVGSGTYSGDTTISAGTLRPGANYVWPYGAGKGNMIIAAAGTLDILDRGTVSSFSAEPMGVGEIRRESEVQGPRLVVGGQQSVVNDPTHPTASSVGRRSTA